MSRTTQSFVRCIGRVIILTLILMNSGCPWGYLKNYITFNLWELGANATDVAVQLGPNGERKFVILGNMKRPRLIDEKIDYDPSVILIIRIDANSDNISEFKLDPTFRDGGWFVDSGGIRGVDARATDLEIQTDGKIVVAAISSIY